MALNGSVSTNKYTTANHGSIGLNLSWTATQSIVNNATTINWTLKSNGTMSSGYYVQAGPVTVKIAGTTVLNTTSRFSMYGGGSYKKTGSIVVPHNQDGTKSVSMSVRAAIYSASVNCTGSKTFALDNITRFALLDSAPDFDDEGNPTISYINPAGSDLVNNLKVRLTWNGGADYTSWNALSPNGGTFTFDLSSYRTQLRTAATATNALPVQYDLQSELGGDEYHNYASAVMNIINADPTAGAVSYSDVNPTSSGITGDSSIIVQSQSTLRIHTDAGTPLKEATIAGYSVNFNGTDYTPDGSGNVDIVKPNYSGTFTATVTVTDSRGNTATATASVPITPWAEPYAECTLERVNGFETNTTLTVNGTISTVTGSSMSITEEHSDDNGGTWIGPNPVTDNTPTTLSLLNTSEWLVRVSVWDNFTVSTPTVYVLSVGKGIPIMFIDTGMNSIGINGFPDANNQLFIAGGLKLKPNDTDAGVELPHNFSTSEKIVGYWLDGRPVYEKTVVLGSTVTVAAGNTSAAGTWTALESGWTETVRVLDIKCYHEDSGGCALWTHLSANWNNNAINVLNVRSVALNVEVFTIQYIKGTFN